MDLKAVHAHRFSRETMIQIVDYVMDNQARFKEFINLFLTGSRKVAERSSWPLSYCAERCPDWLHPHIGKLLRYLEESDPLPGTKRNVMRALQFVEIPKRFHARAINLSYGLLMSSNEPVAVKVFSMSLLARLTKTNPELMRELKIVIEDQLPYSSPGFRSRAKKVLKC